MKWWLIQKTERIFGHKAFWRIARKFNRWIDLTEYYGCRKKIDFKSEERSKQSAQRMNDSGKARNKLEHYQCQFCNGWHLGRKRVKREKQEGRSHFRKHQDSMPKI